MRSLGDAFRALEDGKVGGLVTYMEDQAAEPRTEIVLEVRHADGRVETFDLGGNIITNLGRSNMAHLLAGDDVANRRVHSAKFGDGGHNPNNPTQPLLPTSSDVALFGDTIIEKQLEYEFPDGVAGTKVAFRCTVDEDEGNGAGAQAYSEVGLYDLDGRMLTHKTFGLITKSSAFSLALRYTILF